MTIELSKQQEAHVLDQLEHGWFWNVVIYVKRAASVSFQEAFKYVEEKSENI